MMGTDATLVVAFDDDISDRYIEEYFREEAKGNAES